MRLARFKDNLISVLIVSLLLTGCGSVGLAHDAAFESNYENSSEEPMNIFVSSAQGIVRSVDTELSIMEFFTVGSSDILSLCQDCLFLLQRLRQCFLLFPVLHFQ